MNILALAILMSASHAAAPIEVRYIGNSAFELTDGESTILLDFPYQSGAFGYMAFPDAEVHRRADSLCLFTHRHADHFDATAVAAMGCSVAGPEEVQAAVPAAQRAGPGPSWTHRGATVRCISTPHANVEHCSFLITWKQHVFFVSGDIENLGSLELIDGRVDTLLLPAWLIPEVGSTPLASSSQVIVHHHKADETLPSCPNCVVPVQGATVSVGGAIVR